MNEMSKAAGEGAAGAITYRGAVQVWQCDHMGHMNVMWYVGKFDEGTWNFFASLGITGAYMRDRERGMAAVQQNITYRRELMAGDIVTVRSRLLEMRERVIRFEHVMYVGDTDEIAARCECTGVHIDRKTRKATPFPNDILERGRRVLATPEPAEA
ncbi:MAG TPA: thioesterase family protein [Alphaproteobacteria bacterium]